MILRTFAFCLLAGFAACKPAQKITAKKEVAVLPAMQQLNSAQALLSQGVDYSASGNVPVDWRFQMDFEDTATFTADDGLSLTFGSNRLKKETAPERTVFAGKITGGDVVIVAEEKPCTVLTIRETFQKTVTFTYNGKLYSGCGKYLADNKLAAKWVLTRIGNAAIQASDYNRVPFFEFDIAGQKLVGTDGCNSISGKIEIQGNRIQFGPLLSTKMACAKKSISDIIATKISNRVASWYFKDSFLYLYLADDSLLVFAKA